MFEAIFDDFSLNLYKIDRGLEFLCFLPVCSHAYLLCMCVCTCAHVWGSPPTPPYPHKKFEGPNPIGSRDMAHYVIGCKKFKFSHQSLRWWWGGGVWHQTPPPTTTPKLQLDFKSKKSSCSLGVVVGVGGLNITSTNSGTFYI